MRHQCGSHALFQEAQKPSQDACGKTQDAREAALLSEKIPDQALLNLRALALCLPESETSRRAAYLVSRGNSRRWRPPDQPPQAAWSQAGLGEYLFQRLSLKHD
ncbi:hypothetical protein E2I00_009595 [Balaenoptera physalus]|uniref:Uncharacterized protein n=1 Tax=Balaenoptera physalus TaxID=9770 RepID=A0A6A1QBR2_BALPH|nr:hypothetical protein E2I00_009595 [Balaenoptera physalus]